MNKTISIVLLSLLILVLPNCIYHTAIKTDIEAYQNIQCSDVPFYFNAQPIKGHELSTIDNDTIYCAYQVEADEKLLVDFYHQEMELMGWQKVAQFHFNDEYVLTFENPFQSCIISIRLQSKNKAHVYICVGKKEYNYFDNEVNHTSNHYQNDTY